MSIWSFQYSNSILSSVRDHSKVEMQKQSHCTQLSIDKMIILISQSTQCSFSLSKPSSPPETKVTDALAMEMQQMTAIRKCKIAREFACFARAERGHFRLPCNTKDTILESLGYVNPSLESMDPARPPLLGVSVKKVWIVSCESHFSESQDGGPKPKREIKRMTNEQQAATSQLVTDRHAHRANAFYGNDDEVSNLGAIDPLGFLPVPPNSASGTCTPGMFLLSYWILLSTCFLNLLSHFALFELIIYLLEFSSCSFVTAFFFILTVFYLFFFLCYLIL
jgi:hypothetical protein